MSPPFHIQSRKPTIIENKSDLDGSIGKEIVQCSGDGYRWLAFAYCFGYFRSVFVLSVLRRCQFPICGVAEFHDFEV